MERGPGTGERRPPQRERRRRRRGRALVWALRVAAAAAIFFLGLVVGRALEEAPRPGGEQTIVRTLEPATVGPAVTVTVTAP